MTERKDLIERQERLQRAQREFEARVAHIEGIVAVGIGLKQVSGRWTEDISFQVFVKKKKPESEVAPSQRIPREFEGILVDVIEVSASSPTSDSSEHRPLVGGIQIQNSKTSGIGTLGCIARRNTPEAEPVILSNQHVLYGGGAGAGDEVGQPTHTTCCCCTCGEIGIILAGGQRGGQVDCAVARINADIGHQAKLRSIGNVADVNTAVVGEPVRKVGAMSDLTNGTVASITFPTISDGLSFTNQILVNPASGNFQIGGDSGAVLVNAANEVIGLMWGRNPGNTGPNGVASPIAAVTTALNITIRTSGTGGSGPTVHRDLTPVLASTPEQKLRLIEAELLKSTAGRHILERVHTHRDEVLSLLNHDRRTQVAWHRNQGPTFLAALARSAKEPAYRIPGEIEAISREQAATRICAVFEAQGSEALRADLKAYSGLLIEAFVRCDTADELIHVLQEIVLATPAEQIG